ncbi:MAG: GNAT family N-acetyltransferase [Thermoguttaceae bacterium]
MLSPDSFQIAPATPETLGEVIALVFSRHPPQDALNRIRAALAEYRAGRLPIAGLLAARRASALVGAVFAQVLPGRSATFWPPRLVPGEPEETAARLAAAAVAHARCAGVRIVHALLDGQPSPEDLARLRQAGFTPLAELFYLVAQRHEFPPAPPDGPLDFESCTLPQYDRLCAVVEATYEETLDCPGLDGTRSAREVLEGYGATDRFCPPHWYFVRHRQQDVGCLLLADYGKHGNCELTYMGLVPSARGSAWGLLVTRYAQWVARSLDRDRLVLAVDAGNQPARNMYGAAGFRGWDRRVVFILALEPQTGSPDAPPRIPSAEGR